MPRDALHPPRSLALTARLQALPAAWARALGWLAFLWACAFLLTAPQWVDMARQWLTVSAYQHILFVPPIIGWLVWNRRGALADLTPHAWWPGMFALLGALAVWLVGSLSSIDIVAQAGAVLVLQAVTIALLGPRVGAVLAFPIAFAAFLVPFGEEIVFPLQMLTAKMVIALTHLSGIPAEIDGVFIDTPAGLFEVAEACAGVQFVVAMLTLGVLAAKVGMTGWPRRVAFMLLCLVVPILANGVRAWGTIAIAQKVGVERAAGFDHIIYGWVFFALVVALVMAVAWRWFDRDPLAEGAEAGSLAHYRAVLALNRGTLRASTLAPAIAAIILLAGLWAGLARGSETQAPVPHAPEIEGWVLLETPAKPAWQPKGAHASERLHAIYRDEQGYEVDLDLAAYTGMADPTVESEGAVPPDTPWRLVASAPAPENIAGTELLAFGAERRLAWSSFVVGGEATSSALGSRLAGLGDRLALRTHPRWLVILSTYDDGTDASGQALERFHRASGGPAALVEAAVAR